MHTTAILCVLSKDVYFDSECMLFHNHNLFLASFACRSTSSEA